MRQIITGVTRILVGSLFIFSGIIKANDPLGFSYKLEEYWVEFGMGWDWLISMGVPLASFICILEIVLGVATLVAFRMPLVSWLLLLLIIFFSILTFASAVFGLVKSCGCFGDAIPLTPWQSFIKDLILLVLILILFLNRHGILPSENRYLNTAYVIFPTVIMAWISEQVGWTFPMYFTLIVLGLGFIYSLASLSGFPGFTTVLAFLGSLWLCYHSYAHLPDMDFRPYAVEKSIIEQMSLPENAKPDVYKNVFKYRNLSTGEIQEYDESNYPWDDKNYEFVDRTTTLISKGDSPKITDFSIVDAEGTDLTQDILNDPDPILLVICYNMRLSDWTEIAALKALVSSCFRKSISVIGLSATDSRVIDAIKKEMDIDITFYASDETSLKTIIRSNPGLVLLQQGKIIGKWHINDVPSMAMIESKL